MSSSPIQHLPAEATGNGGPALADHLSNGARHDRPNQAPRNPLLAKLTGLTSIATLAGFILIALGAVLFLLPPANWQVDLRGRRAATAGA